MPEYWRTVLPLGVNLHEDLLRAHDLDNLPHVRARLLQQAQLFTQQSHARVVVVPLSFEAAQHSLALEDFQLHGLDLIVVVVFERHVEDRRG